jgi:hypothetical protein
MLKVFQTILIEEKVFAKGVHRKNYNQIQDKGWFA